MGNQSNNPQSSHGNDQKHSTERQRDDDMSKRGGGMGKEQTGKDQKQRDDQSSGNRSGNDRNRQGSQNR